MSAPTLAHTFLDWHWTEATAIYKDVLLSVHQVGSKKWRTFSLCTKCNFSSQTVEPTSQVDAIIVARKWADDHVTTAMHTEVLPQLARAEQSASDPTNLVLVAADLFNAEASASVELDAGGKHSCGPSCREAVCVARRVEAMWGRP